MANATTPDVVAPSVPTVTATPVNGHQINLSWNASTDNVGTTGYKLYRNGTFVTNVTTGTSYGDTGLTDATTYSYTVAAYDAAGNTSAQSAPAAAATPDVTAPNVPTGLGATAVSSSQINLSWAAPTDNVGVTGYKVYRSGILLTTVTGTSYSNTGLTASTQYTYTVAAYDAANNLGAQSTSATATTQAAAPTQWVTNPSLETDTTGWGKYNTSSSVTRFQVPGGSYDGQWALKIAPTSGTTAGTNNGNGSPIWVSSSVAGKTYTGSAQVRAGTAGEQVRLAIVEYSGSNVVGSYTSPVLPLNDITSWHSISAAYTAQNSGDVIKYSLYVSNFTSTSQYFLADMLSLTSPN